MTTFNAGAVEARLTLDRSDFVKELRAAKREAQQFEKNKINATLNVSDNGDIERLSAQLKALAESVEPVTLDVKIDVKNRVVLASLRKQLQDLNPFEIRIDLDITGAMLNIQTVEYALLFLQAQARDIDIDIDTSTASAQILGLQRQLGRLSRTRRINLLFNLGNGGGGGGLSRIQMILGAILILAPLVVAAIVPLTAAIVAFGGALAGVAGGLGVVGLGMFDAIKDFREAKDAITDAKEKLADMKKGSKEYAAQLKVVNDLQKKFNQDFKLVNSAMAAVTRAWKDFNEAVRPTALKIMAEALDVVSILLPKLSPIFESFGAVLIDAFGNIATFIASPEGARMITFFKEFGAQSFDSLLTSIGNLIVFFGRLFEAFGPFALNMLENLEEITAGWAAWADELNGSPAFAEFQKFANEYGPKVLSLIDSLWEALKNIGKALVPLIDPTLSFFKGLFDGIASIDTGVLTVILGLITGLYVAFLAINAAVKIWNGLMLIASAAQAIWTGIVWLFNAAIAADPIVLVIVAIAALIAGLILAYHHFEGFRNVVDTVVKAVVDAFKWLWDVLFGHSIIPDIMNAFRAAFDWLSQYLGGVMNIIKTVIVVVWNYIKTTIDNVLKIIKGIINVVMGVLTGDWSRAWNGIKQIFSGVWGQIQNYVSTIWGVIKAIFGTALSGIKDAVVNKFNDIINFFRDLPGKIKAALGNLGSTLLGAGRDIMDGLLRGIQDKFDAIREKFATLTKLVPDWKGPPDTDAKLLRPAGNLIMGGLMAGIDDQRDALRRTLEDISGAIAGTRMLTTGGGAPGSGMMALVRQPQPVQGAQVIINAYNPVAERSSETATKEITELAALGVFR